MLCATAAAHTSILHTIQPYPIIILFLSIFSHSLLSLSVGCSFCPNYGNSFRFAFCIANLHWPSCALCPLPIGHLVMRWIQLQTQTNESRIVSEWNGWLNGMAGQQWTRHWHKHICTIDKITKYNKYLRAPCMNVQPIAFIYISDAMVFRTIKCLNGQYFVHRATTTINYKNDEREQKIVVVALSY